MIKFVHKKHLKKILPNSKFVIYYSFSEIMLGFLLIILTIFFSINYIQNSLPFKQTSVSGAKNISLPENINKFNP